jgi:hypothetical protein
MQSDCNLNTLIKSKERSHETYPSHFLIKKMCTSFISSRLCSGIPTIKHTLGTIAQEIFNY